MYNYSPWVSNFTQFHSTTTHFRDTGHFETSAVNDPKMTLNAKRSYVPHICATSIHESQISLHFALWTAVFEIQAILRQVHRMTPNDLTLQGQIAHTCITTLPESQISLNFTVQVDFDIQAILRQVHRMTPKWAWTLQGQRYPTYVSLIFPSLKFWSVLLYD